MIGFGVVERWQIANLCGDAAQPVLVQFCLKARFAIACHFELSLGKAIDRRAVLSANVVALAHALCWVVRLPEQLEQVTIGDLLGIEDYQHGFSVPGEAGANFFVGGVWRVAAGIDHCGCPNTGLLPKTSLGSPETAHGKHGLLQVRRERWLQRVAADEVGFGYWDGCGASGQGLSRIR